MSNLVKNFRREDGTIDLRDEFYGMDVICYAWFSPTKGVYEFVAYAHDDRERFRVRGDWEIEDSEWEEYQWKDFILQLKSAILDGIDWQFEMERNIEANRRV